MSERSSPVVVHDPHPARVVFGSGAADHLGDEVARLGVERAFVVAPPRLAASVAERLGARAAARWDRVVMHVPVEVAASASSEAARAGADGVVAVGGGSAVGLAKAIARERGVPIVAAPTTYSGSEMTSIWGLTEAGRKRTGRDDRVRPRTVVYDPELTRGMPATIAGPSGLNALAHAVEALYARGVDPLVAALAEVAVSKLGRHLPAVVDGGAAANPEALEGALFGAWLAGHCLDRTAMGLHHKLCHVLGGAFGLPHGPVHAVILPYAAAFNRAAAPSAMRRIAAALSADDAPAALFALARRVGCPGSLADLGLRREDLDRAAELATDRPYDNPRPVERAAVRSLLEDAFEGRRPPPAA